MRTWTSNHPSERKDPLVYFQPGEMLYIVKHESNSLSRAQIQNLFSWSNRLAESLGLLVVPAKEPAAGGETGGQEGSRYEGDGKESKEPRVHGDKKDQKEPKELKGQEHRRPRIYSFSSKPKLNVLPKKQIEPRLDVKYRSPQVEMPTPFTLISADVIDRNNPEKFVENPRLSRLVLLLDDKLQEQGEKADKPTLGNGASLEVVSHNWLMGASSESGGTGGPGGRPVPFTFEPGYTSAIAGSEMMYYPFNVLQRPETFPTEENERGKGVRVAILDTAPSLHDMAAAYERWQKVNPDLNCAIRHELISRLLKPNGPLTVHHASYNDLLRMRSVHLKEHNYKMTDHGLFVAGIIHTIAPAAEIHLYEVLNADGVGDLESIAKGLWEVFDQFAGEPLVVNCSLVINIPLDGHQITELDPQILAKIVKDWGSSNAASMDYLEASPEGIAWLERQSRAIRWICDLLYLHGSRVIAAAGNDWKPEVKQPQARFPAAFNSVLGIGALPKNMGSSPVGSTTYTAASYSNVSDEPGHVGVTTLGGEEGEKKGVLGVYIGEFPVDPNPSWWRRFLNWVITLLGGRVVGPRNLTDMAWWAGTSFATPVMAGAIAAVLGRLSQPGVTEDAIIHAYNIQMITEDRTVNHEDVVDVTQA